MKHDDPHGRTALPAGTTLGSVRLRVADLAAVRDFYVRVLGLADLGSAGELATLGTPDGVALLELETAPGARAAPPRSTGLFHVAYLLPGRRDLAATLRAVRAAGWPLQGVSDHAVSEAAYLADPEGNGIELYADRPRDRWRWTDDGLHITTEPLDLAGLLAEAPGPASGVPGATRVGHVHLRVSRLETAEAFYVDRMGFDVVTRAYPGALFVSAGGYHHHLGLNVWAGVGAPRPPAGSLGLVSFEVVVPDEVTHARLVADADDGALVGPDGVTVRVRTPA